MTQKNFFCLLLQMHKFINFKIQILNKIWDDVLWLLIWYGMMTLYIW